MAREGGGTVKKLFLALAALFFLSVPAAAQSGCPSIVYGAVLTAAQWNACFAAKQNTLGYTPVNRAGDTMGGRLVTFMSGAAGSGLNLPQGSAPSSPLNGDVWMTSLGLYARVNGSTIGPFVTNQTVIYASPTPPSPPVVFELWINTTSIPAVLSMYDGAQWVAVGNLNQTTHTWYARGTWAGAPVGTAYGGLGADFSASTGALRIAAGTVTAGTLPVTVGGTGLTTLTGLALGNGTSAMSAYAGTACTNQFPRSLNASGAATCATVANTDLANSSITINGTSVALGGTRTLTLASSDFANQGTATTVLHGNASGNPAFGAVVLTTDVSGILPGANGGTANGFTAFSGPSSSLKTFALPNASATILTTNAVVTVPQGGTGVATLTGLALGNGTSAMSAYAGATCTNQFVRSLSAAGAATCASVSLSADVTGNLPYANFPTQVDSAVIGRVTSGTGAPTVLSIPSCPNTSCALGWLNGTGFIANTTIAAATATSATTSTNVAGGAAGSLLYQTGSGSTSLLAAGSSSQILHSGTTPSWGAVALGSEVSGNLPLANVASIGANTVLGALTATTPSALSMPSCSTSSSALLWTSGGGFSCNSLIAANTAGSATTATTATNLAGGAAGAIPYQSGSATTSLLAAGSSGQLLRSGGAGAPTWTTATFPATAGTSGNVLKSDGTNFTSTTLACANLSDCTSGTWTPIVGGSATYTTNTGSYVKIGSQVCFSTGAFTINAIGTGSTSQISGFPYTNNGQLTSLAVGYFTGLAHTVVYLGAYMNGGSVNIAFTEMTAASSGVVNLAAVMTSGTIVVVSGCIQN